MSLYHKHEQVGKGDGASGARPGRLFPLGGCLRMDGLDLEGLAGEAGKPPILRPVELTACDGVVRARARLRRTASLAT